MAPGVVSAPRTANGMVAFAVLYGVPVMGFALMWLALAAAHVLSGRAGTAWASR